MLDALLSYCSHGLYFPVGEDALNAYVIPLAILLAKGERLGLPPIYLKSLFPRLDGCVGNTVHLVGSYNVIAHADTSFQ